MGAALQLSGMKFGKLTAIERVGKNKHGMLLWNCKCDCGNETVVAGGALKSGHTQSCGCSCLEHAKHLNRKHGKSSSRLYHLYYGILQRCNNPKAPAFNHYGGRGIEVCKEWDTWEAFQKWALANGYKDGLTIDRIDVNGNYEPSNCRWVTQAEQMRNTRKTVYLEYQGERKSISEWCEKYGLNHGAVSTRIRRGWSDPYEILFGRRDKNGN